MPSNNPPSTEPYTSAVDTSDPFAWFVSFDTEDGFSVIYDRRRHTAWISSDDSVRIDTLR